MSTDIALPPELGRRGEPRGSSRWKSILCSGGCGKKLVVIEAVKLILCGACQHKLGSVIDRLQREKGRAK